MTGTADGVFIRSHRGDSDQHALVERARPLSHRFPQALIRQGPARPNTPGEDVCCCFLECRGRTAMSGRVRESVCGQYEMIISAMRSHAVVGAGMVRARGPLGPPVSSRAYTPRDWRVDLLEVGKGIVCGRVGSPHATVITALGYPRLRFWLGDYGERYLVRR